MRSSHTKSDYFRMNNNIFDVEKTESGKAVMKLKAIELRVLAELYALAPFRSLKVKVRQVVLAQRCSCSVSTIKRAVSGLLAKGYIRSAARDEKYAADLKILGTYTYTLPPIEHKGFFYVNRKTLEMLDKIQTRVYLFICKCARSTMDCWNSFNDIAKQLGLQRCSIIKTIGELIKKKVIDRIYNRKRDGSFADNTYQLEDVTLNEDFDTFMADFFSPVPGNIPQKEDGCPVAKAAVKRTFPNSTFEKAHKNVSVNSILHSYPFCVKIFCNISCGFFYLCFRYP